MRLHRTNERRGVILMVVLALLTLFAIVGITFVLYADSEAASARVAREAETAQRADVEPEQALAFFLGQLIYDVNDDVTGVGSALRGHSLGRTMYGAHYGNVGEVAGNLAPFSGVGRLHYPSASGQDDYTLINYTWFSGDGFVRDPERYGTRTNAQLQSKSQPNSYVGGNAPYTYPDLNNMFLAAVKADGTVLAPSFHRNYTGFGTLAPTNPNWNIPSSTNPALKYMVLRPRPADHPGFPLPEADGRDVKNLVWAPGGNDSIWIDLGAPVMTAPDGTKYKMLFAPLIIDLDGRINLGTAGNILGNIPGNNRSHVSNQGWGAWEVNLAKVLYADNANIPTEYLNLFVGKNIGHQIYGKYGANGIPSSNTASVSSTTPAHKYAQGDVNGLNENAAPPGSTSSSRPLLPGSAANPPTNNPNPNPPTNPFALFEQGYQNGGVELNNTHPLLYNLFRPPWYNGTDDRVFRPSDMEALLRPNSTTGSAVDAGSSTLVTDLIRLCPTNFGPSASSNRFRNLVTTLSMDLGVSGVSPYWWNGMPPTAYLSSNPANLLLPPLATTAPPFPTLPPSPTITTSSGSPSEFTPNWQAASANPAAYATNNPFPYLSPGGRIRLNRPLPPYPHMGAGVTPPYTQQPPNNPSPYGVAYNLTNAAISNQYTAALNARQSLANDIYRRLLAITGVAPVANVAAPQYTDLAPRRWLAQLAVNIVDFIDEDDIITPFNFYTTTDGLPAANIGATQGPDDGPTAASPLNTGANPTYWVFGTELPKVVLNEVLAEANNSNLGVAATTTESVKVWVELFNTMQSPAANTQLQDAYRVPLSMAIPGGGNYSPYRISIAQTLMNQPPPTFTIPNPPPAGSPLPDVSANVLGKGFVTTPPLLPQSTSNADFAAVAQKAGGGTQAPFTVPGSGNTINAGIDPQGGVSPPYFLVGPLVPTLPYHDPFAAGGGVPANTPVIRTANLTYHPTWTAASTTDERTTGLTVMLRRLANPYLPFQGIPGAANYNPYVTVDYIQNVPIQTNTTVGAGPTFQYPSRGKRQPYAGLTQVTSVAGVPQANSLNIATSPVTNQTTAAMTPPPVIHTFGSINGALPASQPQSGHYDWLVHLDRTPISPMELLHVSGYQPYQLTQRFILGADGPLPANAGNLFGHYAPWLDAPLAPATIANVSCPWWFDATLAAGQSHRLYRLFEFLECGDRAYGVNGLGRIPGKVNINTIWDAEILQALIDANPSMGITVNFPGNPTNAADPVYQIFKNLLASRSPTGIPGLTGVQNATDRPFMPLSTGLNLAGTTQFPTNATPFPTIGTSVSTDTILRMSSPTNQQLLFQNPTDTRTLHPYLQTQLLSKLYNNVTTRSNTFAVFLTVGFFQVTNPSAFPPTLGAEIGRSEGRQVRHRMFAIVDRTNLSVFSTTTNTAVTGPTVGNPFGTAKITMQLDSLHPHTALKFFVGPGMQLVIEPGTANEETVIVQSPVDMMNSQITANFLKPHPNPAVTGNPSSTYAVIIRGNPGPWVFGAPTPSYYDPRLDPAVVPYFSIID